MGCCRLQKVLLLYFAGFLILTVDLPGDCTGILSRIAWLGDCGDMVPLSTVICLAIE